VAEPEVGAAAVGVGAGTAGGWEPADWAAVLRRRRRGLVLTAVGLPVALAVLLAVLSVVQRALPTTYGWVLLGLAVVVGAVELWPLRTSAGRREWDARARADVLVTHALTAHDSVGADRRELVTRRAQAQRSLASVAPLGYVLLVLLVAYLLFENTATPVAVVGTVLAVALAAVAVRSSRRRGAAARRWLADPLPPD
jgi:uncharacterized membrane protein (GlpM family)